MMMLNGSIRPHPRVFFRARVAAESCFKTHCRSHLQAIALKNDSSGYNDELVGFLCELTSRIAFSRVIMMYQSSKWPSWFRLRNAAYIACGCFVESAKKKQSAYAWRARQFFSRHNPNSKQQQRQHENNSNINNTDDLILFSEEVFRHDSSTTHNQSSSSSSPRVPFSVFVDENDAAAHRLFEQEKERERKRQMEELRAGRTTVGSGVGRKTLFLPPR